MTDDPHVPGSTPQELPKGIDRAGLTGRVAIVTGGGQGIGRVFARSFAAVGATVVIAEINETKGESVAREVQATGGKALAIRTDVGDPRSVDEMAARALKEFGRIDILVNNAAIFSTLKMRPFDQIPLDEWDQVMRVNVTGIFLCCRAVVAAMRAAGWGRIINMSSGVVTVAPPNYLHYPTSKTAVLGLTRALARELGDTGITVNALMPGAIFTETPRETITPAVKDFIVNRQQSIHRPQTPEDLIGLTLFLSSDAASFITGQAFAIDGGATFR